MYSAIMVRQIVEKSLRALERFQCPHILSLLNFRLKSAEVADFGAKPLGPTSAPVVRFLPEASSIVSLRSSFLNINQREILIEVVDASMIHGYDI